MYREEIFAKLAKQLVWQRCLHPSYTASPTVPVDQLLWLDYCTLQQYTPNIILTSSQLRTFIRVSISLSNVLLALIVIHQIKNYSLHIITCRLLKVVWSLMLGRYLSKIPKNKQCLVLMEKSKFLHQKMVVGQQRLIFMLKLFISNAINFI